MADLVAIDLPGGPQFVAVLRAAWEDGDAVSPVDQRLAPPARRQLLDMLRPAWVVTEDGGRPPGRRTGGRGRRPGGGHQRQHGDAERSCPHPRRRGRVGPATSARLGVDPGVHRWLACLPVSHIGGLSVVTRALLTGTPLAVLAGFEAAQVSAEAAGNVLVSLVPTALARVKADAFYKVVLGGSAPPASLPPNVVTTYGMTETGSGVVYDGVALDGVEISLSPASEVLLRGAMLFRAYRDGTAPLDRDGWFATGDAGVIDETGRLQIKGRISDMIITGGENVWPSAVEHIIRQHPGVAEVAVSSRPDPEWGERLVACVVPARPAGPPSLAELRALVAEQFASFATPKELLIVEALPKTSIGKVKRQALRERLLRQDGPT